MAVLLRSSGSPPDARKGLLESSSQNPPLLCVQICPALPGSLPPPGQAKFVLGTVVPVNGTAIVLSTLQAPALRREDAKVRTRAGSTVAGSTRRRVTTTENKQARL